MLLSKQRFLVLSVLSVFLLTFITGVVDAKPSTKAAPKINKAWATLDGFRSAKFGMTEKQVTRAIGKDFKISRGKVKKATNAMEQTTSLEISVPKLMATGGKANIGYVFGQKSRELMQVNVMWGSKVSKSAKPKDIIATANLLRTHFTKKRYQDDSKAINLKLSETTILVFRGKDKKGRMVILSLISPPLKDKKSEATLSLSYILDPISPDVLTIKDGDF
jgi:hypothetical protein